MSLYIYSVFTIGCYTVYSITIYTFRYFSFMKLMFINFLISILYGFSMHHLLSFPTSAKVIFKQKAKELNNVKNIFIPHAILTTIPTNSTSTDDTCCLLHPASRATQMFLYDKHGYYSTITKMSPITLNARCHEAFLICLYRKCLACNVSHAEKVTAQVGR